MEEVFELLALGIGFETLRLFKDRIPTKRKMETKITVRIF